MVQMKKVGIQYVRYRLYKWIWDGKICNTQ